MVEIEGAKTAQTLRLNDPERLVVDVENSLSPNKHQQTITVNAPDLKSVRIAQYQMTPPVMRVVLDLAGPREFGLTNNGNKLVVTVFSPRAASRVRQRVRPGRSLRCFGKGRIQNRCADGSPRSSICRPGYSYRCWGETKCRAHEFRRAGCETSRED